MKKVEVLCFGEDWRKEWKKQGRRRRDGEGDAETEGLDDGGSTVVVVGIRQR